jgi:hypothetical protein
MAAASDPFAGHSHSSSSNAKKSLYHDVPCLFGDASYTIIHSMFLVFHVGLLAVFIRQRVEE